ncbi:3'-5' exonuclease, partial [Actinomyces ruminis]
RPPSSGLTTRAVRQVTGFHELLTSLRHGRDAGDGVADILDAALDASGYLAELRASDDPQDASRVENLAELHAVASDFQAANPDGTLADFLERVSLVADSDQLPPSADVADQAEAEAQAREQGQVTLMTVHTAKGLEFPVVFVTGLEDGTFPHSRSLADETELAEERRLAYVAVTRARERLYLTRAAVRSAWGAATAMPPSRFLDDVPEDTIEWKRVASSMDALRGGGTGWGASWDEGGFGTRRGYGRRTEEVPDDDGDFAPAIGSGRHTRTGKLGRVETPKDRAEARRAKRLAARGKPVRLGAQSESEASDAALPEAVAGLKTGDRVRHKTYGEGSVIAVEGTGRSTVARVEFIIDGAPATKRLMLRLAPVEKI